MALYRVAWKQVHTGRTGAGQPVGEQRAKDLHKMFIQAESRKPERIYTYWVEVNHGERWEKYNGEAKKTSQDDLRRLS